MNRESYLQLMGIPRWFLRDADEQIAVSECFSVSVKNKEGQPIGLILADVNDAGVSVSAQQTLLEKIAPALSKNFSVTVISIDSLPSMPVDFRYVILLGDHVQRSFDCPNTPTVIRAVNLSSLSCSPEDKKNLWREMKRLRDDVA